MGLPVCRLGDIGGQHQCWPARSNISGSTNVFINGIPAHRLGDAWAPHTCQTTHSGSLASGSNKVYVNGLPLGRIGDAISCGGSVMTGSLNVFAG